MKIYDITKGQLKTLWVFGIFFWLAIASSENEIESSYLFWLSICFIPAVLVFYTQGWKKYNK